MVGYWLPLVITLLGHEAPNALLVSKWNFIFGEKKERKKEREVKERKEKSGKQSVPGAFPGH